MKNKISRLSGIHLYDIKTDSNTGEPIFVKIAKYKVGNKECFLFHKKSQICIDFCLCI